MGLDDGFLPTVKELSSVISDLRKENNNLKRLLTNTCMALENRGGLSQHNKDLYEWWQNRQRELQEHQYQHQAVSDERKRLLAEQARAKLTPEERKVLGIE